MPFLCVSYVYVVRTDKNKNFVKNNEVKDFAFDAYEKY